MSPETAQENRLARESSPYLLLHKNNPVDWYPWGEEALEKARREEKPIFLSVGYSTCYWCHVMEEESFRDPAIAETMNRHFVNIKVDREERPELDEIYMIATQLITGQGGWPNSVFLTPELKPFFAGTYFPPEDRYGRPGFPSVLAQLAAAWENQRSQVEQQAEEVAKAMRQVLEEQGEPGDLPEPGAAERALQALERRFDPTWGGFGGAPKFPTPSNLFLLLELADERPRAAEMLTVTLDRMARGGIYDQLAGGFHRYATDREWKIPHFEKMLYDNGLLLEAYARQYARTGEPEMERIVRETVAFLDAEMTSPEGAFWSAIDAATDGQEGAYYVWTRSELDEVLGEEEAAFLAPILGFDAPPFFEGGHYVLHLPQPLAVQAKRRKMSRDELLTQLAPLESKLLEARSRRQRPLTDDKVLAEWNGMAIGGLAVAGQVLEDDGMVARAEKAAELVLTRLYPEDGPLLRVWRQGEARLPAYLGDYAFLVRGLLALHQASGKERWLQAATDLADEQVRRLRDPRGGYFVAEAAPDLLFRSKEIFDGATPAANAVAVLNLIELGRLSGEERWQEEATAALKAFGWLVSRHPEAVGMMAMAARRHATLGREETPAPGEVGEGAAVPADLARLAESRVEARATVEAGEGWRPFRVELEIASGWHVNANPASQEFLIPTRVDARQGEVRKVRYPEGRSLEPEFAQEAMAVYQGRVEIEGQVRFPQGGGELVLTYQACDESRCLPPVSVALAAGG